jgi:Zn-dependent peptidase ImmA (M78 family)
MAQYKAAPMKRVEIRAFAKNLRERLHLNGQIRFPVVEFLEIMEEIFPGFSKEIVSDHELPDKHAETDITNKVIRVRESVYDAACDGSGRDRMTIAHEIGHYLFIVVNSVSLARSFDKDEAIPAYMDPEWQAKCFAGELLMPHDMIGGMSPYQIAVECGVSQSAANYQHSK